MLQMMGGRTAHGRPARGRRIILMARNMFEGELIIQMMR
jgi:hypothetical protein